MKNYLKCPKCGSSLVGIALVSNPPQHEIQCIHCNFKIRASQREDLVYSSLTQSEVDEFYSKYVEVEKSNGGY